MRRPNRRILVVMPFPHPRNPGGILKAARTLQPALQSIGFADVTMEEVSSLLLDNSLKVTDMTVRVSHDNSRVTVCGTDAQGHGFGHFNYPHSDVLILN